MRAAAYLPPLWRNLLLAVHVATTVSVLGIDLALLALAVAGWSGADPQTVYPAAHLIGALLLAPFAVASLGTGVLLAVTTPWGLFRYWWVTIKLAITAALTGAVLFLLVPRLRTLAESAIGPVPFPSDADRLLLVIAPAAASALLVLALALAIFKPGWRLRSS